VIRYSIVEIFDTELLDRPNAGFFEDPIAEQEDLEDTHDINSASSLDYNVYASLTGAAALSIPRETLMDSLADWQSTRGTSPYTNEQDAHSENRTRRVS
jgi:hypothetical protein